MKITREFRESELEQLRKIKNLIREKKLPASIVKIDKWIKKQPDFSWPQNLLTIWRDIYRGVVWPDFKIDKINPKGRYTRAEAAELLNLSYGRARQLEDEGKLILMGAKYNRGNRRVFSGAELIKYRRIYQK